MKDWFSLKIEYQFIWFICLLITLHLSFRFLDWPGQNAWLLFIPSLFSMINLLSFILKGLRKSIWEFKYLLIAILYLMISAKAQFSYYNILFSVLIVAISTYATRYEVFKIERLKHRLVLLVSVNFLLIIIPDISIYKYIISSNTQTWDNKIEWVDFQGNKPENIGKMDANINTEIHFKYNNVYNSPRFISLAGMDKSGSWIRPNHNVNESNLLKHEQLHFDITEWTRRELVDSINNLGNITNKTIIDISNYFQVLSSKRQAEYDSISKHGIDFNGQIIWNKKVKLELN